MSVHVAAAVYRARFGSPMRKALAVKLADISNDDGASIFMSVGRMARELEMGERTVQRLLKEFVTEGILVVEQLGGRGPKSTTHYRLDLEIIAALPRTSTTKGAAVAPLTKTSRVPAEAAKGAMDDKKGAAVTPNPSLPVKDPSDSERGAQARPAPADDDVRVVEAEIIEPIKGKAKRKRAAATNADVGLGVNLWGQEPCGKPARQRLADAMEDGWAPGQPGFDYAKVAGLNPEQTLRAFEKFKVHFTEGKGKRECDDHWDGRWKSWVLNEIGFSKAGPSCGAPRGGRGDKTAGLNF